MRTSAQPPQEPAIPVLGVRRDNRRLLFRAIGVVGAAVFRCHLYPLSIFLPNSRRLRNVVRCPWPQDSPSVAQALLSCMTLRRFHHSQEINVLRPSLWANTRFSKLFCIGFLVFLFVLGRMWLLSTQTGRSRGSQTLVCARARMNKPPAAHSAR